MVTKKPIRRVAKRSSIAGAKRRYSPDLSKKPAVSRKVYVRDLKDGDRVEMVFRVVGKSRRVTSGKPFLVLTLADRTGQLDARVISGVNAADEAFMAGDHVLVTGVLLPHCDKP